jgi:hypothetical protein
VLICLALICPDQAHLRTRGFYDFIASSDALSVINDVMIGSRIIHMNKTLFQRGDLVLVEGVWLLLIVVFL